MSTATPQAVMLSRMVLAEPPFATLKRVPKASKIIALIFSPPVFSRVKFH